MGKIAGLRYISFLFPYIWEICKQQRTKLNEIEKVSTIIKQLKDRKILDDDFFANKEEMLLFRAETATIALANKHGKTLKAISNPDDFIPA